MKIKIQPRESFRTYVFKESVIIDTEDYPELEGKSLDEIKEYIQENGDDMSPPAEIDYEDSLLSALENQDTDYDKVCEHDYDIILEIVK